jgi:hypothetical protein
LIISITPFHAADGVSVAVAVEPAVNVVLLCSDCHPPELFTANAATLLPPVVLKFPTLCTEDEAEKAKPSSVLRVRFPEVVSDGNEDALDPEPPVS